MRKFQVRPKKDFVFKCNLFLDVYSKLLACMLFDNSVLSSTALLKLFSFMMKSSFRIYIKYTKIIERKSHFNETDVLVFCCIINLILVIYFTLLDVKHLQHFSSLNHIWI